MTRENTQTFIKRKQQHITQALDEANEALGGHALDMVRLRHEALPDLNFEDIELSTQRLGKSAVKPFLVSAMTAGHHDGIAINQILADACITSQWAMAVGSQRRQLDDHTADQEMRDLRKRAPELELFGNLGISQLITHDNDTIMRLIDSLEANAMIIHCNALQECLQPEGTPQFKGSLDALGRLAKASPVPIIVKETGCGFSIETLKRLNETGVKACDLSGYGGTHWGRIEGARANEDSWQAHAAQTFKHWGITSVETLVKASDYHFDFELWASGGVRTGLDAAKYFALGAKTIGLAKPLLQAALKGKEAVIKHMQQIENECRVALFCTGTASLAELTKDKLC